LKLIHVGNCSVVHSWLIGYLFYTRWASSSRRDAVSGLDSSCATRDKEIRPKCCKALRELLEAQNIGVVTVPLVHEPVVDLEDTLYVSEIPPILYTA